MYNFKKEEFYKEETLKNKKILNVVSLIRTILILAFLVFIICYFTLDYKLLYLITSLIFLILFFVSVPLTNKYYINKRYLEQIKDSYDRHYARRNNKINNNKNFFDKGNEFKKEFSKLSLRDKYLLEDIDVFGKNSLYEHLSSARSVLGRKKVADALCHGNSEVDPKIIEQIGNSDDIVSLEASLGFTKIVNNMSDKDYIATLCSKFREKKNLNIGLIICYIIEIVVIILACLKVIPVISILIPLILNLYYQTFYRDELNLMNITDIYKSLEDTKYVISSLAKLDINYINQKYNKDYFLKQLKSIKRLTNLWQVLAFKNNLIFKIIFNSIIGFEGLYQFLFNKLQLKEEEFKEILTDIADLEYYVSFANIVSDYEYTIAKNSTKLEFKDLTNILIPNCVANDFSYTKGTIITGSNMSGKTTFLRTIGENILLSNACRIVTAKDFSAPNYILYTALRIKDDLSLGVSSFYAEIEKIKEMIEDNNEEKKLCLIDEIFKGTNTLDRVYGAKMLIKKLEELNYDFIISTHDFELCEINTISNYHFAETYLNEYKDITFDYKLKEGKSKSTNAIFLLKRSGIINDGD